MPIKIEWTAAGISLERVKRLVTGEKDTVCAKARKARSIEASNRFHVADGLEMVVEPAQAHTGKTLAE